MIPDRGSLWKRRRVAEEDQMSHRLRTLKSIAWAVLPLVIMALAAIAQKRWW
jgi:hypothetical protein